MIYAVIGFLLAYPFLFGFRDKWCFPFPVKYKDPIHYLGFIIRGCTASFLLELINARVFIPLYGFYFWTVFDLITGVGTTAQTDKHLGKWSWLIKTVGLLLSFSYIIYYYNC